MPSDCIFCRIAKGELPSEKVYENGPILAILDINPIASGHVLVLPREHHELWTDLPADLASELAKTAQIIARGVVKAAGAEGFNLLMNNHRCSGQAIPHAHFHVIPRKSGDGVRFNWAPKPYGAGEMEKVAASLRAALKS